MSQFTDVTRFLPEQERWALQHYKTPRRYQVEANDQDGTALWIAGVSNQFYYADGRPRGNDLGNVNLTLKGHLLGSLQTDVEPYIGRTPTTDTDDMDNRFRIYDNSYGFTTESAGGPQGSQKTCVRVASLFNPDKPETKATYIRLTNEDGSYINKILTPGGGAFEVKYGADGKHIQWLQLSFDSKGDYKPVKIVPGTPEGEQAITEMLQGGQPADEKDNQNGSYSGAFDRFAEKTGLTKAQILYALGLSETPTTEAEANEESQLKPFTPQQKNSSESSASSAPQRSQSHQSSQPSEEMTQTEEDPQAQSKTTPHKKNHAYSGKSKSSRQRRADHADTGSVSGSYQRYFPDYQPPRIPGLRNSLPPLKQDTGNH